jgi:hypothetical protein
MFRGMPAKHAPGKVLRMLTHEVAGVYIQVSRDATRRVCECECERASGRRVCFAVVQVKEVDDVDDKMGAKVVFSVRNSQSSTVDFFMTLAAAKPSASPNFWIPEGELYFEVQAHR